MGVVLTARKAARRYPRQMRHKVPYSVAVFGLSASVRPRLRAVYWGLRLGFFQARPIGLDT